MKQKNTEMTTKIPRFFYISFIIMLILTVASVVSVLLMNSTLKKGQKLRLTVPEDLNSKIEAHFKNAANSSKEKVFSICHATSAEIKNNVKKQLESQDSTFQKALVDVGNRLASLEKTVEQNRKLVASLADERERKATEYLQSAKTYQDNPEIAQILYLSALSYSNDKAPILNEFIDRNGQLIYSAIEQNDITLARERLTALAAICDANISNGSISDMEAIPALKEKLSRFEEKIAERNAEMVTEQQNKLNAANQTLVEISSYEDSEKLLKEVTDMACDASLTPKKDLLITRILQLQACLTSPDQPLMLPTINSDTPWLLWLTNFIARLKSDLPTAKKLEDIGTAAETLQAAKQSSQDEVAEKLVDFESVSRNVYIAYWQERVDRTLGEAEPSMNDVSSLLSESNTLKEDEQEKNIERIVKLNQSILRMALKEYSESLASLKEIENSLSAESFVQIAGGVQNQYMQILLRIQGLQKRYPEKFNMEYDDVSQKINFLGQLIYSYKNKFIAEDLKKSEAQRQRFADWAGKQLNLANEHYEKAEKIGDEWFKTEHNIDARENYASAWIKLMAIHSGDLSVADPALYQRFIELKQNIEKHYHSNDNAIKQVKYKRIADF